MEHSDGSTGSSSRTLPASHHGCGLRCPRCMFSPPHLGTLASLAVERLRFLCYKETTPNKPTFLSRQFLFCLLSAHASSWVGSRSVPLGQRSESTAISGWQHLRSVLYPGRPEQMLEMKVPKYLKGTFELFPKPWGFFGAATKNIALLWQVLTAGYHRPLHLSSKHFPGSILPVWLLFCLGPLNQPSFSLQSLLIITILLLVRSSQINSPSDIEMIQGVPKPCKQLGRSYWWSIRNRRI